MDPLTRWSRETDKIDYKILKLFERRMVFVRRSAEYKKKHGLKLDKKSEDGVIEKVTKGSCDANVLLYTEGLFNYMHKASLNYQCNIIKH
jgi:chorismate mutase